MITPYIPILKTVKERKTDAMKIPNRILIFSAITVLIVRYNNEVRSARQPYWRFIFSAHGSIHGLD
jgi:hypothetical protein